MKRLFGSIILFLLLSAACWAEGNKEKEAQPQKQTAPQAGQTAPPPTPASQFWTGDGGKGKSITILPPRAVGLAKDQAYLPDFVANELVSNFRSFTAMTLFDRVNNQKQYDELLSGFYADNDKAGLDLGHLASTDYMLVGDITKTSTGYALQLTVNSNSDKTTVATFSGTVSIADLDNLTGVRQASLDLIPKMGIQITAQTRTELTKAATTGQASAQTAMAQGIVAQRGGTVVEALSRFIQANDYDPSLAEAASRLNILTANVTSGNIGADVRNDIQWRDQWVSRLKECEEFYANYVKEAPPYYLVYSTNIKQGTVDYQKRTVALTLESIALYPDINWFSTLNQVVVTVKNGLTATKRAGVWGLNDWPRKSVSEVNPFVPFVARSPLYIEVEILNSDGRSINAKETVPLVYGWQNLLEYSSDQIRGEGIYYAKPYGSQREIVFPSANPELITDNLSIRISTIDGIPSATAAEQKRINILTTSQYLKFGKQAEWLRTSTFNDNVWLLFRINNDNYYRSVSDVFTPVQLRRYSPYKIAVIRQGVTSGFSGDFNSVTIGANVSNVGGSFSNAYERNGRRAGTYTYNDNEKTWIYLPR